MFCVGYFLIIVTRHEVLRDEGGVLAHRLKVQCGRRGHQSMRQLVTFHLQSRSMGGMSGGAGSLSPFPSLQYSSPFPLTQPRKYLLATPRVLSLSATHDPVRVTVVINHPRYCVWFVNIFWIRRCFCSPRFNFRPLGCIIASPWMQTLKLEGESPVFYFSLIVRKFKAKFSSHRVT